MSSLPHDGARGPQHVLVPVGRPLSLFTSHDRSQAWSGRLSGQMTLTEFYWAFYRPVCLTARDAGPRNLKQYEESLGYWSRFTGDPPLAQIDDYTVALFLEGLLHLPGRTKGSSLSPNTVRKHCTHLQAIIDRPGPRSREARFRKAQGLLDVVPFLEKPAAKKKEADENFSLDEIGRILRHVGAAIAPAYLSYALRKRFWKNLFLCDYNTGLRVGSLTIFEWAGVRQDTLERWWIHVRVKGGDTRRVHCNSFARAAIDDMRPITGGFARVFHFPHGDSWLQAQRRRILIEAGLPPERRFGFHGFRRAMCTEGSQVDPLAVSMQAGHKDFATTQDFYINPGRVASGMANLPQPELPDDEADPQQRLFD